MICRLLGSNFPVNIAAWHCFDRIRRQVNPAPDVPPPAVLTGGNIRRIFAYNPPMANDNHHRVYMFFMDRRGWQCQFLETDLKTPLPRKLTFASPDKIIELVERGNGLPNLESRQALGQALELGRGGVFLELTAEQYAKLKSA